MSRAILCVLISPALPRLELVVTIYVGVLHVTANAPSMTS